jgi:DNA-binding IclR family transcriptional regulator
LLAFADNAEIDDVLATATLQRFTDATVTSPRKLREQLTQIREQGYSVSDGEIDVGVRGVAAPILSPDGRIAAGLSVAGLAFRITDALLPGIIVAVTEAAGSISERLAAISG